MNKDKLIALRLTPMDYQALKSISDRQGMSEVVRQFITRGIQEESKKKSEAQTLDGSRFAISQR